MGQRLNIEIIYGDTSLANCYYHWSAYADSALALTESIIERYYDLDYTAGVELAVKLLEKTGAGINEYERSEIRKCGEMFKYIQFIDCADRNKGLISVSERGKNDTRAWEEGRVTIDLKSETFSFDLFWSETVDEYVREHSDDDAYVDVEALSEVEFNLDAIPFNFIENLVEFVDSNRNGAVVRSADGDMVITWIS